MLDGVVAVGLAHGVAAHTFAGYGVVCAPFAPEPNLQDLVARAFRLAVGLLLTTVFRRKTKVGSFHAY